jgi:hypothetical protein
LPLDLFLSPYDLQEPEQLARDPTTGPRDLVGDWGPGSTLSLLIHSHY